MLGTHRETPIWDHQQRSVLVKNLHLGQIDDVLAIDQLDVVDVDISGVRVNRGPIATFFGAGVMCECARGPK